MRGRRLYSYAQAMASQVASQLDEAPMVAYGHSSHLDWLQRAARPGAMVVGANVKRKWESLEHDVCVRAYRHPPPLCVCVCARAAACSCLRLRMFGPTERERHAHTQ